MIVMSVFPVRSVYQVDMCGNYEKRPWTGMTNCFIAAGTVGSSDGQQRC